MRFYRLLLRFNAMAFALLLIGAMVVGARFFFSEEPSYDHFAPTDIISNDSEVQGEVVMTSQGSITIYKSLVPNEGEAFRDVRFVAMKTGNMARLVEDADALIYRGDAVGKLGYIATVLTEMRNDRPVYDVVFISFPSLERFVIARGIDALDTVEELDDRAFSAVVWDKVDTARFIVVDAATGTIKLSRALDYSQSGKSSQ